MRALWYQTSRQPRHADVLICTGPVTRQARERLLRIYEQMPDPKFVIAVGSCGISGGVFQGCYNVIGQIDKVIPVNVYIPGCPPRPKPSYMGYEVVGAIIEREHPKVDTPNELDTVSTRLKPWTAEIAASSPDRIDAVLAEKDLHAAAAALREWGYLSAITGLDLGVEAGKIEVLYHFCAGPTTLSLRVDIPRDDASLTSLCDVISYASLYERELIEMLGIT